LQNGKHKIGNLEQRKVLFLFVGDGAAQREFLDRTGANSKYPHVYCEVGRQDGKEPLQFMPLTINSDRIESVQPDDLNTTQTQKKAYANCHGGHRGGGGAVSPTICPLYMFPIDPTHGKIRSYIT
jgi:hypothetical protein